MAKKFGTEYGRDTNNAYYLGHTKAEDGRDMDAPAFDDPEEFVKDLFKGATSPSSGKFADQCSADKGEVAGIGPECAKEKEIGEQDAALCFYDRTLVCIKELRAAASEACYISVKAETMDQFIRTNNLSTTKMTGGEAGRKAMQAAIDAYDACVEEIPDKCECTRCLFTIPFTIPKEKEDKDTEDDDETIVPDDPTAPPIDPDDRDTPSFDNITTTSSYGPIPRIVGRYVVGGNIVWLGTARVEAAVRYARAPSGYFPYTDESSLIDLAVGVAAGELDSLLRVWIDDVLVYNDYLDLTDEYFASTDLNLSIFADNANSGENLPKLQAEMRFYRGGEGQHLPEEFASTHGFGKSPAYRGLSYIYIKDLDLKLFGGSFPQIRFDVTSAGSIQAFAGTIASASSPDIYPLQEHYDPRTRSVLLQNSDDTVSIYNYETLQEQYVVGVPVSSSVAYSVRGEVLELTGNPLTGLSFIDPASGDPSYQTGAYSYTSTGFSEDGGIHTRAVKLYDTRGYPLDITVSVGSEMRLDLIARNYSTGEFAAGSYDLWPHDTDFDSFKTGLMSFGNSHYFYVFAIKSPAASQTALVYTRYKIGSRGLLMDNPSYGYDTLDNFLLYASAQFSKLSGTISSTSIWGADTSGVKLCHVVRSTQDNSFLLFFECTGSGTNRIVKISGDTFQVAWSVDCPFYFSHMGSGGENSSLYSADYFYFVTPNEIVRLTRETGELLAVGTLASLGLPAYEVGSAQYYDSHTRSLMYVATEGASYKLVRTFFDRVALDVVTLADVVRAVVDNLPYPRGFINVDDLENVSIEGFLIEERTTLKSFLDEVSDFYQLSVIDDGVSLYIVRKTQLPAPVSIDESNDVIEQSSETLRLANTSLPDTVRVTFADITAEGLVNNTQIVSLRAEEDALNAPREIRYDFTVYDRADRMRQHAEVALRNRRAREDTVSISLMPRKLGLTPHDQILIGDKSYRLTTSLLSPNEMSAVSGHRHDSELYELVSAMDSYALPLSLVSRPTATQRYKPVVLFINALTEDDAVRAATTRQVAYSLIEAPTPDISPVRLFFNVSAHLAEVYTGSGSFGGVPDNYSVTQRNVDKSPVYTSQEHTKAAHSGVLVTPPKGSDTRVNVLGSDPEDTLTVRFARADSIDLLLSTSEPYTDVLEDPTRSLLIVGREFIKYATFTVDPGDARLVTFSNIYRGVRGTDPYIDHTTGEAVYLYTPDTIKDMSTDAAFTKRRAQARVYMREALNLGAESIEYVVKADAGSARPWPPTDINVFEKGGDGSQVQFSFKRQEPTPGDFESNGGVIYNTWGSMDFLIKVLTQSSKPTPADLEEFGAGFIDQKPYELFTSTVDGAVETEYTLAYARPPAPANAWAVIAQVVKQGDGEYVTGHPAIVLVHPAQDGTNPPS